jgi:hypothetical protein
MWTSTVLETKKRNMFKIGLTHAELLISFVTQMRDHECRRSLDTGATEITLASYCPEFLYYT